MKHLKSNRVILYEVALLFIFFSLTIPSRLNAEPSQLQQNNNEVKITLPSNNLAGALDSLYTKSQSFIASNQCKKVGIALSAVNRANDSQVLSGAEEFATQAAQVLAQYILETAITEGIELAKKRVISLMKEAKLTFPSQSGQNYTVQIFEETISTMEGMNAEMLPRAKVILSHSLISDMTNLANLLLTDERLGGCNTCPTQKISLNLLMDISRQLLASVNDVPLSEDMLIRHFVYSILDYAYANKTKLSKDKTLSQITVAALAIQYVYFDPEQKGTNKKIVSMYETVRSLAITFKLYAPGEHSLFSMDDLLQIAKLAETIQTTLEAQETNNILNGLVDIAAHSAEIVMVGDNAREATDACVRGLHAMIEDQPEVAVLCFAEVVTLADTANTEKWQNGLNILAILLSTTTTTEEDSNNTKLIEQRVQLLAKTVKKRSARRGESVFSLGGSLGASFIEPVDSWTGNARIGMPIGFAFHHYPKVKKDKGFFMLLGVLDMGGYLNIDKDGQTVSEPVLADALSPTLRAGVFWGASHPYGLEILAGYDQNYSGDNTAYWYVGIGASIYVPIFDF